MKYRRCRSLCALAPLLAALSGCEFESPQDMTQIEMNSCSSSATCERGSVCIDSLCVAQAATKPLEIVLQVTPLETARGTEPLPIVVEPFTVDQPLTKEVPLPDVTVTSGQVIDHGVPIEATVSFTPIAMVPGLPARPVTVTVAPGTDGFRLQLLSDVEYRMVVQPTDMRLPPYSRLYVARKHGDPDVTFNALITREQELTITGAGSRELLVTAFDSEHGERISSTATTVKGKATLVFAEGTEDTPYWLQIRAVQSFDAQPPETAAPDATPCDSDTPTFPTFAIKQDDIMIDGEALRIELPKLPERIRFEGTVELCKGEQGKAASITTLPITLHSETLEFEDSQLTAAFDATTSATYDKNSQSLRFCVQAMPGEYTVLATPPAGMGCALFAEHRRIEAPRGQDAASGTLLSLPSSAYVAGIVQTSAEMPLASASVEARALGRSADSIELSENDRSVTNYNRSSETVTDKSGTFELPIDVGSYDIVVKPLTESGFPWNVHTNVPVGVGARTEPISKDFDMLSPVVVTGTLIYPGAGEDAQDSLAGAEIEAYALIDNGADKRAVAVGKTTADSTGLFTLLLPLSIKSGW